MNNPTSRDVSANRFRAALQEKRPLIGIWSMLNSATAIEGLSHSGFDWILMDGEHAPMSLQDAIDYLRILDDKPIAPIVRLAWNDRVLFKQHLDAGARTIMLPQIDCGKQAEAAVRAMRYPPRGYRGVALMQRASRYGRVADYFARADDDLFLIVQIESRAALDRVEEIASVDGVDALFFGPGDLAASVGLLGQPDHPDVTAMISDARNRHRRIGKPMGVLAPNPALAEGYIGAGFDFVSVANDCALLFNGADAAAARFQAIARGGQFDASIPGGPAARSPDSA